MTTIEWTEQTWNPTTGCDRISPGCDNCYALTLAKRLKGMEQARGATRPKYQNDGDPRTSGPGFGITTHAGALSDPARWRKPRRVFVNSMSDLFHARVPASFIARTWEAMADAPQHTFQVLTKRPERAARILPAVQEALALTEPLPNVWLGTSVENQKYADLRIPALLDTPAAVRFLSCEPLLGPVHLTHQDHSGHERDYDGDWICLDCSTDEKHVPWRTVSPTELGIDWVIVGGESGPGARPFDPQWAADLIRDSRAIGAAPFVKQLGSVWARANNASDTKGGKPDDWPADLRVREFPATAHADCKPEPDQGDDSPIVRVFRRDTGWTMTGPKPEDCTSNFHREQDGRPACTRAAVWKVVEDHGLRLDIGFYCNTDLPAEHRPAAA